MANVSHASESRTHPKAQVKFQRPFIFSCAHHSFCHLQILIKNRKQNFADWVDTWALPEMYSGINNRGAGSAWCETLLETEARHLHGTFHCNAIVDIYKCVHKIRRPVLYHILKEAGLPPGTLQAYRKFMEGLQIRNDLSTGLGAPYT